LELTMKLRRQSATEMGKSGAGGIPPVAYQCLAPLGLKFGLGLADRRI
jgi:hypothetical protein